MTDITERLRLSRFHDFGMCKEAASEIERLREEKLADARAFGKLHNIIGELEGKIERLRDELETFRLGRHHQENERLREELELANALITRAEDFMTPHVAFHWKIHVEQAKGNQGHE